MFKRTWMSLTVQTFLPPSEKGQFFRPLLIRNSLHCCHLSPNANKDKQFGQWLTRHRAGKISVTKIMSRKTISKRMEMLNTIIQMTSVATCQTMMKWTGNNSSVTWAIRTTMRTMMRRMIGRLVFFCGCIVLEKKTRKSQCLCLCWSGFQNEDLFFPGRFPI